MFTVADLQDSQAGASNLYILYVNGVLRTVMTVLALCLSFHGHMSNELLKYLTSKVLHWSYLCFYHSFYNTCIYSPGQESQKADFNVFCSTSTPVSFAEFRNSSPQGKCHGWWRACYKPLENQAIYDNSLTQTSTGQSCSSSNSSWWVEICDWANFWKESVRLSWGKHVW